VAGGFKKGLGAFSEGIEKTIDILLHLPEESRPIFVADLFEKHTTPVEIGMCAKQNRGELILQTNARHFPDRLLELDQPLDRFAGQSDRTPGSFWRVVLQVFQYFLDPFDQTAITL